MSFTVDTKDLANVWIVVELISVGLHTSSLNPGALTISVKEGCAEACGGGQNSCPTIQTFTSDPIGDYHTFKKAGSECTDTSMPRFFGSTNTPLP